MSNLTTLAKSLKRGEVLLPSLRKYLEEEGKLSRKELVVADARMTIKAFKERIEEFNHGEIVGDLFHPSQLGTCQRAMWFDLHKAPRKSVYPEDPLRNVMIFETGTYVGVLFANLCERAGILVKREAAIVSQKLRILGHADLVVKIDGVTYVVEVKTINSNNFRQLTKEPKLPHKQQAHAYMKGLGIKWAIIIYLEKDRHAFKEYVVPFSEQFYTQKVERRIADWFVAKKSKSPPKREGASPNELPCRWCDFQRVCFGSKDLAVFLAKKSLGQARKIRMR